MKICLIGSTRFRSKYYELNHQLTLAGHCVYSVAFFERNEDGSKKGEITDREKELLDLVHLRKVQESNAVVVVTDEAGYYGDSTRRELTWARMLEKEIYWSNDVMDMDEITEPLVDNG